MPRTLKEDALECLEMQMFDTFSTVVRDMSMMGMHEDVHEVLEVARQTPGYRKLSASPVSLQSSTGAVCP